MLLPVFEEVTFTGHTNGTKAPRVLVACLQPHLVISKLEVNILTPPPPQNAGFAVAEQGRGEAHLGGFAEVLFCWTVFSPALPAVADSLTGGPDSGKFSPRVLEAGREGSRSRQPHSQ